MINPNVTSRRQLFQSLGAAALAVPALASPRSKASVPAEPARLDSNESAYGPFPSAIRAMAKAVVPMDKFREKFGDLTGPAITALVAARTYPRAIL